MCPGHGSSLLALHTCAYSSPGGLTGTVDSMATRMSGGPSHQPSKDLALISKLPETGSVVPVVDRPYSLGDVPGTARYLGAGHSEGKLVIAAHIGGQSGHQRWHPP